ncbi:MAG: hypothetical protein AB1553_11395 [Nitrospirota bacterium]
MRFFMVDSEQFVLTNVSEDTIRGYWKDYYAYRYDITLSFYEFLRENGIDVRIISPSFNPFGFGFSHIEISLN